MSKISAEIVLEKVIAGLLKEIKQNTSDKTIYVANGLKNMVELTVIEYDRLKNELNEAQEAYQWITSQD